MKKIVMNKNVKMNMKMMKKKEKKEKTQKI
jgi:hypothetical protein